MLGFENTQQITDAYTHGQRTTIRRLALGIASGTLPAHQFLVQRLPLALAILQYHD